jgi:hypothetical protein
VRLGPSASGCTLVKHAHVHCACRAVHECLLVHGHTLPHLKRSMQLAYTHIVHYVNALQVTHAFRMFAVQPGRAGQWHRGENAC